MCRVELWKSEVSPGCQQGWLMSPGPLEVLSVLSCTRLFCLVLGNDTRSRSSGKLEPLSLNPRMTLTSLRQRSSCLIKYQGQWNKTAKMVLTFLCGVNQTRCLHLEEAWSPKFTCTCQGHSHSQLQGSAMAHGKGRREFCTCALRATELERLTQINASRGRVLPLVILLV